jgi:hypothetical protein
VPAERRAAAGAAVLPQLDAAAEAEEGLAQEALEDGVRKGDGVEARRAAELAEDRGALVDLVGVRLSS